MVWNRTRVLRVLEWVSWYRTNQKFWCRQNTIEHMSELLRGVYPGQYSVDEVPEGTRVVPQFDDLVHPMQKIGYVRTGDSFVDDDGYAMNLAEMRRWWAWVKFSAVPA